MRVLAEAPLTGRDTRAIQAAVGMLMERFPVEKVILYGSKARGDADEDSDIDLLLVTSRPIHWRERKAIIDALFDIEMAHDAIISILIVTMKEWSEGIFTAFPIYQEIMRDGVLAA
jgi:predicted nucleotidyltransferase